MSGFRVIYWSCYVALWRLVADKRGTIAVFSALAATMVMGFAGLAIDVGYYQVTQRRMQATADDAAYAAAQAKAKGGSGGSTCSSGTAGGTPCTAALAVAYNLGFADGSDNVTVTINNPPLTGSRTANNNAYEVIIRKPQPMWFANLFLSSQPTVSVRAVGAPSPITGPACVMALHPTAKDAVLASGSANVDLSTCDVVDNSSNTAALEATGGSSISAKDAYIVGNYSGNLTVSDTLKTGSTAATDPYANRTAPSVGACGVSPTGAGGYTGNYTSPSAATTINPGVYCGDLTAGGPLTLSPGVYIIKGGSFKDQGGHGTLSGGVCTGTGSYVNATGGVTIYLVRNGGNTGNITVSSCLAITAPTTGATKGMAFWVDANETLNAKDAFSGGSIVAITGAIYSPVHEVDYTGSSIATSSCTQIVAYIVNFTGTANFTHNCDGVGVSDPTVKSQTMVAE